jgi:Prokaryotic RING finger family 1
MPPGIGTKEAPGRSGLAVRREDKAMLQLVILAAFILVLYLIVRGAATLTARLAGARFKAYRHLAARYYGKYESRGLSEPPTVSFMHGGSSVRVGLAPTVAGQPPWPRTRVVARFARGLPFRMELAPISRPSPAQAPKGTRHVRVGDAEFDRAFITQANDAEIAREFLNLSVRCAVENLRRMAPPSGMLISVNPERMLVQVDRNLGAQVEALGNAVREALDILEQLQTSVAARLSQGISIVDVGPASEEDAGPPVCKVCGDAITEVHVVCTTCRTPHHRDCWSFIGGCSIFGCTGKQCVTV